MQIMMTPQDIQECLNAIPRAVMDRLMKQNRTDTTLFKIIIYQLRIYP